MTDSTWQLPDLIVFGSVFFLLLLIRLIVSVEDIRMGPPFLLDLPVFWLYDGDRIGSGVININGIVCRWMFATSRLFKLY
jgi:hypothetical protein